jgi:hypothetical protein
MINAVLDSRQSSHNTLVIGDFVRWLFLLWHLSQSIVFHSVRGGLTLKSTLHKLAPCGYMMYLIRTFLPFIWSEISVIASLLERDILTCGLRRIAGEVVSLRSGIASEETQRQP